MSRKTEQEFKITAFRPAGGLDRDPTAPNQDEDQIVVYASGRGKTMKDRRERAKARAMEVLSPHGWDRCTASLTMMDADNEYRQRGRQLLSNYFDWEEHEDKDAGASR